MKIRAECRVECRTAIPALVEVSHQDRVFRFHPGPEGDIARIEIVVPVPEPQRFYSEIKTNPDGAGQHVFIVKTDDALIESIVREFQEIEAHLAFTFNVHRVRWDEMKYELLTDSDEERQRVGILGMQVTKRYHEAPIRTDAKSIRSLIESKGRYSKLVVPLAFYREGKEYFFGGRFIPAFFNFYFILEGLFGEGKTKNYAVERAFKASRTLRDAVAGAFDALKDLNDPRYRHFAQGFPDSKEERVDKVISRLVATRGLLHHFSGTTNRPQGSPFSHEEYEVLADLARAVTTFALMFRVVEINQGKG